MCPTHSTSPSCVLPQKKIKNRGPYMLPTIFSALILGVFVLFRFVICKMYPVQFFSEVFAAEV
jgi:hypothetical protein